MKRIWTWRTIDAPATELWGLITDPELWPAWGPSVRSVELAGDQLGLGSRGTVSTALRLDVPFVITAFDDGHRWSWDVAGLPATDHAVEPLGPDRCRVGFGVPWPAVPYLAVCRAALRRLDTITSGLVATA